MEITRDPQARRRRLLERGTDRLAFITGKVSVSDCGPSSPYSLREDNPLTPSARFSRDEIDFSHSSDQYSSNKDDSDTTGEREEVKKSYENPKNQGSDKVIGIKKKDDIGISESKAEERTFQTNYDSKPLVTSVTQRSSDKVVDKVVPTARVKKQFPYSSKQVSNAVSASGNVRLLIAVSIALLVVLSNHGFGFGAGIAISFTKFRPLFLVMLTDLSIILWLLMRIPNSDEKEKVPPKTANDEYDWAENIGDMLEAWFVFQNVASAIFMDCSICAIMMISGLCL
ncbi:hypothetical protein Cni_G26520 [Canna indica]|uniref:Uncharacterized protein n=1 Tax=Canna indica TaxID=4628 RepID=A0AAQ3KZ55_9LILI|nr:hypothetical protein Cni_G26520 [Canna indica]